MPSRALYSFFWNAIVRTGVLRARGLCLEPRPAVFGALC